MKDTGSSQAHSVLFRDANSVAIWTECRQADAENYESAINKEPQMAQCRVAFLGGESGRFTLTLFS
jgi:hypothetical protein